MPLPLPALFAQDLATELATLDPTGFGSLSLADRNRMKDKLFLALATVTLSAIQSGTVTVNGTTVSACAAGGAAGTCTASGSIS